MNGEVEAAVRDQLSDLLGTAMALTGTAPAATALVGEVSVRARRRRSRIDPGDPAPGLRLLLMQTYLAARPAKSVADPAPEAEAIETVVAGAAGSSECGARGGRDDIDRLASRLDRLTRTQRAAVLLSFRDRLTYAEIAAILDRGVAKVARSVVDAQTGLDAEPYEIVAALDRLSAAASEPAKTQAAAVRFERRQAVRRRRAGLAMGVVAVVLALAVAIPTVIIPRLFPVHVRAAGEWAYGYESTPPAGLRITERFLLRNSETSYLSEGLGDDKGCTVEVSVPGTVPSDAPSASPGTGKSDRAVTVNGRRGWFADPDHTGTTALWWEYAPSASAVVSCDRDDAEPLMLSLATAVRFTEVPLVLPFRVGALPSGYEVTAVGTSSQALGHGKLVSALVVAPVGEGEDSDNSIFVYIPGERLHSGHPRTVKVNGVDAVLAIEDGNLSLCLPVQTSSICLASSSVAGEGATKADDPEVRRLVDLAAQLTFPADVSNRSTWFDARDALPH